MGFIEANLEAHGVEPTCGVLQIARSTYDDYLAKRADPPRRSDRLSRDAAQGRFRRFPLHYRKTDEGHGYRTII